MTPWGRGFLYGGFTAATTLALVNTGHYWPAVGFVIASAIVFTSGRIK